MTGLSRNLAFHPALNLNELNAELPAGLKLGEQEIHAIEEKISLYSMGVARRNTDFKHLAGFAAWNLIELRWDFGAGAQRISVRLLGAETDKTATVFLLWHVKDPLEELEVQRMKQNEACEKAIERMKSLDFSN